MPDTSVQISTLKNRSDFLRAAKSRRQVVNGFILQARERQSDEVPALPPQIRVGYTCSKKVGNAVMRNRAKRRLREIARKVFPEHGLAGWDYVLIGRSNVTGTRDFEKLLGDLVYALRKLHSAQTGHKS